MGVSLALSLTLAGCMGPALPKDAYIKGVSKLENATTYEKKTTMNVDTETKGAWETHEKVLFSLLNESTIEATSVINETKQVSETTLHITGGFDYFPLDSTLQLFHDEQNNTMYIKGDGLVTTFSPLMKLSPTLKDKWVEVGKTKENKSMLTPLRFLSELNFTSVWESVPEEQFVRLGVTEKEKQEGIRDVVTVSFQQDELTTYFPEAEKITDSFWFEGLTFTAYLDRKGVIVKEEVITKLTYKNEKNELIVHAAVSSSYNQLNEELTTGKAPKTNEVVPVEELFSKKTETETKTEKPQ